MPPVRIDGMRTDIPPRDSVSSHIEVRGYFRFGIAVVIEVPAKGFVRGLPTVDRKQFDDSPTSRKELAQVLP